MRYIQRACGKHVSSLLKQFPSVCILGPRQCGKTFFARHELSHWRYFDLEKPAHRAQVEEDPGVILTQFRDHLIFDEAQRLPDLFPILRSFVDEQRRKRCHILLLGSASPSLIRNVSESLAGRVGFFDMSPFLLGEVGDERRLWLAGGFPDAYLAASAERRMNWFESYTRAFIERDLHLYEVEVQAQQMRRLWSMISHMHAGILNASELGNALGMSYHTVNRYIDILERTFLVRRLRPYYANIGKRLVKSPKIYIRDSGLLHSFLGIASREDLATNPKRGASWEGFVIEQVAGCLKINKPGAECYFYQTSTRREIDLLVCYGGRLVPIEIKVHSSPIGADVKGLATGMKDLGLNEGYVVHPEGEIYSLGSGIKVVTLRKLFEVLQGL